MSIRLGKYKHYKGKIYEVVGFAKHTETGEELVVYKTDKINLFWVRPKDMFLEKINIGNKKVPRFEYLEL